MHRTFELYLRYAAGGGRFTIVGCADEEIMAHVHKLLEQDGAEEVEVREAGQVLFTVARWNPGTKGNAPASGG